MYILSQLTNRRFVQSIIIAVALVGGVTIWHHSHYNVLAVSTRDFQAGRIIDDEIFYNKDAMSVQQIQNLLQKQVPSCDTHGTQPAADWGRPDLTRAEYAKQRWGISPPFVCLKDYFEHPTTKETSYERGPGRFAGSMSAAEIIHSAAQKYNINPQVLITLLRKESAGPLTNDSWPFKRQYRFAMGYACPDSGPGYGAKCDDTKAGFYNQMMTAAWQLNYYRQHPNDYRYGLGWNDIQYSPDPSCGTKRVKIENIATLSLYIYTPYTPNDSSLANYPGTAHCGAYGNRNFFMFFNQWFGSSLKTAKLKKSAPKSTAIVAPGLYALTTPAAKAATINASDNGSQISLQKSVMLETQQFFIQNTSDGYHVIYNKDKQKVLDIHNSDTVSGAKIQLWEYHGGCNQKWSLQKHSDGTVSIVSSCEASVGLDVHGGKIDVDGTKIQLWEYHGGANQRWRLSPVDSTRQDPVDGVYGFVSPSGKKIDIKNSSASDGAEVILWNPHGGTNQKFSLEKSGKYYTIRSMLDKQKVLDIHNSDTVSGAKIQLWEYHGGCNQKWSLQKHSDGTVSIVSSCEASVGLDVHGGKIDVDGTKIQLWEYHGGANQRWRLVKL